MTDSTPSLGSPPGKKGICMNYEGFIGIADWKVFIRARYEYVFRQCMDYRIENAALTASDADLSVEVSDAELAEAIRENPASMDAGYIESICIFRGICRRLPPLGGLFFHAAVIEDCSEPTAPRGYAFTADSGTGKTTHIRLWQRTFGTDIRIVNGDKPILRRREGVWYAYGTPWCGKEGWNINTAVPLSGVCFLRRGERNTIRPYPAAEAVTALFSQIVLPDEPDALTATLNLLDGLVREVPFYELHCTISEEAAQIARRGMMG